MKRYIKIIIAVLLLIVILVFTFFEIKDVPNVKNGDSFDIEKKDLGGLKLFYGMLMTYYGEDRVSYMKEDEFSYLEGKTNTLLVVLDNVVDLDSLTKIQLSDFVSSGNEVLLIANVYEVEGHKCLYTETNYFKHDTLFNLNWVNGDSMTYKPYLADASAMPYSRIKHFENDTDTDYETLLFRADSLSLFQKTDIDSMKLYVHCAPMLFQNRSAMSGMYRENFTKTFSHFDSDMVVMHQFKNTNLRVGSNKDSVLQYILSQRPLKYAYYLTLLTGLLYVFFSSKRKQREIPIEEKSKNTSLDYVETASSLFMAQNQNRKLVKHMRRNFLFKVRSSYFLNSDDPLFVEKLSKKSKYPEEEIKSIIHQLNLADNHEFNDDQLVRLFNDINSFDKNRK